MAGGKAAIRIFSDFSSAPSALRSLLLRAGSRRRAISAAAFVRCRYSPSPVSGFAARGRRGIACV